QSASGPRCAPCTPWSSFGLAHGVGHPSCLGTRPPHLSTGGKGQVRTPPSGYEATRGRVGQRGWLWHVQHREIPPRRKREAQSLLQYDDGAPRTRRRADTPPHCLELSVFPTAPLRQ